MFAYINLLGSTNIVLLDAFKKVITAIKDMTPSTWETTDVPETDISRHWVDLIWNHLSSQPISTIENLPLVPVQKRGQIYYRQLQKNPKVMLFTHRGESKITKSIKKLLVENGVVFAVENMFPEIALNNQQFLREYILRPNESGILNGLQYLNYRSTILSERFCADFKKVIENTNVDPPSYISEMKIFTNVREKKVSIRDSHIVDDNNVPPEFIESKCNISLVLASTVSQRLQEKLPFKQMLFETLMKKYVASHELLTPADSKFIIEKVSSTTNITNDTLSKLKSKVQVKTEKGSVSLIDSLFEKTSKTDSIFWHESSYFPEEGYDIAVLRKLGLRSELHVKSDIIARMEYVNKHYAVEHSKGFVRKIEAILFFCAEKSVSFPESLQWIPVEKALPSKYPPSLSWKASSTNVLVESFQNIYPWECLELVGSTSYIVHEPLAKIFSKFPNQSPSLNEILNHLENVVRSYNDDDRGRYKGILMKIYRHLGETFCPEKVAIEWKQLNLKLWHDNRFIEPRRVTLLRDCLNLSPYMYSSKNDFPISFRNVLQHICDQSKSKLEVYIHVLSEIKQDYDMIDKSSSKDLALAIEILGFIADNCSKLNAKQKELVYIPIENEFLKLHNSKECFCHDRTEGLSDLELKNQKVVHKSVNEKIVKAFQIPDLVSEILNDEENDVFESWGQAEPLTVRLNRLLKDYQDGLPIFKELIQNADDAKATEISFLYDGRSNDHLMSSLIDKSMKHWQGPALWVHNNAIFTKEDFENIRRLNAGTKESDTTKIGKFGLGFNSVYHLTDVPCFLSGNYIVYFDPHSRYLGRALRSKNECGKRIDLRKNKALIPFNDQFKVFDGIFKARIDFRERNFESYDQTLFRLPLRNRETASRSDICNLNYTSHEMELLLDKLKQSLETIILFTENITKVSVYYLKENVLPTNMTLMFNVMKEVNIKSSNLIRENLLVSATEEMRKNEATQEQGEGSLSSFRFSQVNMIHYTNESENNKPVNETWFQLAFTGSQENINFAKKRYRNLEKGLIPCGGVAINYRRSEKAFKIVKEKNKIFCFLPLPKESGLPVCVNGAFSLTNDRKQLAVKSSEVKSQSDDWNLMLAKDLGRAYFDLLLHVKSTISYWNIDDWFGLFPAKHEVNNDAFNNTILASLVNSLIRSPKDLFPIAGEKGQVIKWVKWDDIRCPPINMSHMNRDILLFMNWYFDHVNLKQVCLSLPSNIRHLIKSYTPENTLNDLCLVQGNFFDIFFKFISQIPNEEVLDNIMSEILNQQPQTNTKLRTYLRNYKCIPTLPHRKLKRIQDLVKPNSTVAQLYDEKDEIFPCREYISKHYLFLQELGMNSEQLPWDKLILKAKEIATNQNSLNENLLVSRSKILMKLMTDSPDECTINQKREITQISFLPVKRKSKILNQINYYEHGKIFCSAREVYTIQYANIVYSSAPILDCEIDSKLAEFLGVDRIPSLKHANAQLSEIEAKYKTLTGNSEAQEVCEMLCDLYTFLDDNYRTECRNQLATKSIIYENDRKCLATPKQIFFGSTEELVQVPGYIYKVASDLTFNYKIKSFLKNIGVKESPDISDYITVLQNVKTDYRSEPVPKSILNPIVDSILPKLARSTDLSEYNKEIFVPDEDGIMQVTSDVCFKDVDWIKKPKNVKFVHPEIANVNCEKLGIKAFRAQHLLNSGIGIAFGQYEDLTKRIQNLLQGYTEKDVIKELLQNADDSNATEVEFVLDCRNHDTGKVLSDEWKKLQGPALVVANNGKFTENDLEAIQNLGEGNKSKNYWKTGRYGVGFNAVYNITDCPTLHVRIENESYLCIFDPNLHYNIGGTMEAPGQRINSHVIKEYYGDVYNAHVVSGDNMPNTLFRLPLRTQEMAERSKILNKEIKVEDIESYFKEICQYAREMLLFLVQVKKLKFTILKTENSNLVTTSEEFANFPYQLAHSELDRKREVIDEYIKNPFSNAVATVNYKTCIRHVSDGSNCCQKHFRLVEQIGFVKAEASLSEGMDKYREFYIFPKGAVAYTTQNIECDYCRNIKESDTCKLNKHYIEMKRPNVYCTLPISRRSGLPVLVNGNFLLEYETRRDLFINRSSPQGEWNNKILSQCVLPCYIFLLKQLQEIAIKSVTSMDAEKYKQEIYKFFPKKIEEKDTNYWHFFNSLFYDEIFTQNDEIMPITSHNNKLYFARPKDQFIVYVDDINQPVTHSLNQKPVLRVVLQNAGIYTDLIPEKIAKNFEKTGNDLTRISPQVIRERMKRISDNIEFQKPLNIQQSCFKDVSSLSTVLEYCLKDLNDGLKQKEPSGKEKLREFFEETEKEFISLPLCLLADSNVTVFSESHSVFVSRFSNVFKRSQSKFIHAQLVNILKSYEFPNILRKFKLQDFVKMLPCEINEDIYRRNSIICFSNQNQISRTWLKTIWKFLKKYKEDLNDLRDWLFLLARSSSTEYLLPVSHRTSVLYLAEIHSKSEELIEVLKMLPIFEVSESDFYGKDNTRKSDSELKQLYPQEWKQDFFGSAYKVDDLVNALLLSHSHCQWKLNEIKAHKLLSHFENLITYESNCLTQIQNLPIFIKYNGSLTKLDRKAVVLPQGNKISEKGVTLTQTSLPMDGLEVIESNLCILFLVGGYPRLYEKVSCKTVTIIQFYLDYIFPHLHMLSASAIFKHMDYVKSVVSRSLIFNDHSNKMGSFIKTLSSLKFIQIREGFFKAPNELYEPSNQLFKLVFTKDHFPPPEFCEESWLKFLSSIGLIAKLSQDLAIKIAKLIENLEDEKAEKTSELLCRKISDGEFTDDKFFLDQLKSIKFLIPKRIGKTNEKIYKSLNKSTNRIYYNGSVYHAQENLVWTTKLILPTYACCFENKTFVMLGVQQGLKRKKCKTIDEQCISFEDVLSHIDNITNNSCYRAKTKTCKCIPESFLGKYKSVFEEIYEFLDHLQPLDNAQIKSLMKRSLILVNASAELDIPGRSNLSNQVLLTPYINQVDVYWGKYFDLFKKMGCQQSPNTEQYFDVLREIKLLVNDKQLGPNELAITNKAVTNVSSLLKIRPFPDNLKTEIYLPCIKAFRPKPLEPVYLLHSYELIYIDDYHMQNRLGDFKGNFLLSRYEGGKDSENVNKNLLDCLPAKDTPKRLSELVKEVLKEPERDIEAPREHFSNKLKLMFSSEHFFNGLDRLMKHEYSTTENTSPELEKVFEVLGSTKISVLQQLQTVLLYNNKVIPGSESDKEVYAKAAVDSFEIYLQFGKLKDASSEIVQGILTLLEIHSIKFVDNVNVLSLLRMLEVFPHEIPELLDKRGIPRDAKDEKVRYLPDPGDLVPQTLYPYLSYNFQKLETGHFVAVGKEFEGDECYIFGIVRGCKTSGDVHISQFVYDVQIGKDPDSIIELKAFELHGFDTINSAVLTKAVVTLDIQEEEPESARRTDIPQSYEEAIEEIRKVLRSVSGLDEGSKKKVIRRLYLKWHPDKHEECNQQFATKVFQFLLNEIEKSDHRSVEHDFEEWAFKAKTYSYSKRRSNRGFSRHSKFWDFDFSSFFEEKANNPQPAESKRWYRQAEKDLQAAKDRRDLNVDSYFQWHCFMAKQV